MAQFGVVFLLFALGLEFSLAKVWCTQISIVWPHYFAYGFYNFNCPYYKGYSILLLVQLKAVGPVAVLGGLLQIVIFMFLCGISAMVQ